LQYGATSASTTCIARKTENPSQLDGGPMAGLDNNNRRTRARVFKYFDKKTAKPLRKPEEQVLLDVIKAAIMA